MNTRQFSGSRRDKGRRGTAAPVDRLPILYVAEGDSITHGGTTGVSTSDTYAERCQVLAGAPIITTFQKPATDGAAISTLVARAATIDGYYDSAKKNVLSVFIGTNDCNSAVADVVAALKEYCLRRIQTGYVLVVNTIPSIGASHDTFVQDYNAAIRADHSFYHFLADVGADARLGAVGAYANTTYFLVDEVHLTSVSHDIVAPIERTAIAAASQYSFAAAVYSISIRPTSATMDTAGTQQFYVSGVDANGHPVRIRQTDVQWTTDTGSISSNGLLTAGLVAGSFTVTATYPGITPASAAITVNAVSLTYATWDATKCNASITLSNGNLTEVASATAKVQANQLKAGGKWYWEVTISNGGNTLPGVADSRFNKDGAYPGADAVDYAYFNFNGTKINNAVQTAYGSTFADGDIISVALDMDNGKVWFAKNGTWQASGDPAAGTNPAFTGVGAGGFSVGPIVGQVTSGGSTTNFGATAFTYTVPTGFNAGVYV